tara:strand:+ start:1227 stop:1643 length:417 start_codon:yes stop_codon:yes gene_type:complete
MIVLNLKCENCKNEFEGWFSSSKSCDQQIKKGFVECTQCSSQKVQRGLSRPNVTVKKGSVKSEDKVLKELKSKIKEVNRFIEKNCDYVGDQFSYEARRIHYEKSKKKPIYGTASKEDVKDLEDEGIEVASIPWIKEEN